MALLALLAGGCAGNRQLTDEEFCERQAQNDPVVKQMIIKGVGNQHFQLEGQDQLHAAQQDALLACLRSRGVIRRGGVERLKPP